MNDVLPRLRYARVVTPTTIYHGYRTHAAPDQFHTYPPSEVISLADPAYTEVAAGWLVTGVNADGAAETWTVTPLSCACRRYTEQR